jgi:hypothetical protein
MERLDATTDLAKREQIMLACGYNCMAINNRPMLMPRARRQKYPTEEGFLTAEAQKPPKGMCFERKGDVLIGYAHRWVCQFYFGSSIRRCDYEVQATLLSVFLDCIYDLCRW